MQREAERGWHENVGAYMFVAVALIVVFLMRSASTDYYSNDAAQYWSTISNLLQGRGLKTSAVYYEVQAVHGMPAHQTVWPPGLA